MPAKCSPRNDKLRKERSSKNRGAQPVEALPVRRELTDFHELAGALSRMSTACSRVARARDAVDLATEHLRLIAAGQRLPRTRKTTGRITSRTSRFFKLLAGGAAI